MAYFEIFEDRDGRWRWRLQADNGEIVASATESYRDPTDAERGAADLVYAAQGATVSTRGGGWASPSAIQLDIRRVEK